MTNWIASTANSLYATTFQLQWRRRSSFSRSHCCPTLHNPTPIRNNLRLFGIISTVLFSRTSPFNYFHIFPLYSQFRYHACKAPAIILCSMLIEYFPWNRRSVHAWTRFGFLLLRLRLDWKGWWENNAGASTVRATNNGLALNPTESENSISLWMRCQIICWIAVLHPHIYEWSEAFLPETRLIVLTLSVTVAFDVDVVLWNISLK